MTADEQRIAIAEVVGLNRIEPLRRMTRKGKFSENGVRIVFCENHHGGAGTWADVPDYLIDLNAMHEAEKIMTDLQRVKYRMFLSSCTQGRGNSHAIFATASQRAEAFLRALNLWKE